MLPVGEEVIRVVVVIKKKLVYASITGAVVAQQFHRPVGKLFHKGSFLIGLLWM